MDLPTKEQSMKWLRKCDHQDKINHILDLHLDEIDRIKKAKNKEIKELREELGTMESQPCFALNVAVEGGQR